MGARIDDNASRHLRLMRRKAAYAAVPRQCDRDLPHSLMDAHSAAQLRDRIRSMRLANIYEPQHYRHLVSGVQIVGGEGTQVQVRSSFAIVRTLDLDGDMKLFAAGECEDRIEVGGGEPRFTSRHFKLDSRVVETYGHPIYASGQYPGDPK